MTTFNVIVEGPPGGPNGDYLVVSPPALRLERLEWMGEFAPDIIILPKGTTLVKVGLYASAPPDTYRYRIASIAKLNNGRLVREKSYAM